jgi:hypothetical protein
MEIVSSHEYFRVDLQGQLPASEIHRRQLIKERLEKQYGLWREQERQSRSSSSNQVPCINSQCDLHSIGWHAITQPGTVSFLGVSWHDIRPTIQAYVRSDTTRFAVLSELQLSTIKPAIANSNEGDSNHHWLHEQYCNYAICIHDFGNPVKEYQVPLIEAAAVPSRDSISFEGAHPDTVSARLPMKTSTFRVITFPQARFSFIEDEVMKSLRLCDLSNVIQIDVSRTLSSTGGGGQSHI